MPSPGRDTKEAGQSLTTTQPARVVVPQGHYSVTHVSRIITAKRSGVCHGMSRVQRNRRRFGEVRKKIASFEAEIRMGMWHSATRLDTRRPFPVQSLLFFPVVISRSILYCKSNVSSTHATLERYNPSDPRSCLQRLRHPMPPAMPNWKKRFHSHSFYVEVGIMYIIVPSAVIPTPTHHHVSGLYGSPGLRIVLAFLLSGSIFSPIESLMSRLTLLLPVGWAPPVAVAVGFRVCVGNISGGL